MTILTDPPLYGVVACCRPRADGGDHDASFPIPELCIDVGLTQEEAEARVPIGHPPFYRGGSFAMGGEHRLCRQIHGRPRMLYDAAARGGAPE
jgi:endoglucanase